MLIVSKYRYIPVIVNTLVLFHDDLYYYIHRDVYDQAVILADQFDNLDSLQKLVTGSHSNERVVQWFYDHAPKPIHILAPYLSLVEGEIEQDMVLCCGILHVITSMIHVRNFVTKPEEVRRSVSFSLSIREEYAMAWDRFFLSAIPYEQSRDHIAALFEQLSRLTLTNEVARNEGSLKQGQMDQNLLTEEELHTTTKLEGISVTREAIPERPKKTYASSEAERKATKNLLTS